MRGEKIMLIANPIYDVTFKRLLENDRVAKFLIGTILDCKVLSLVPGNSEYTDDKDDDATRITLFRMDFTAKIVTEEEGEKTVIIELQKAQNLADVYRFKRYLGKEYHRTKLPIISIYILGFDLSVDSPAFVARPDYWDLTTNEKLFVKDSFVEQLTHRAYFIQTKRIKPSLNTRLEKLLSVFEQANFVGDGTRTKEYPLETDDPDIKEVLGVLNYVAMDKKTREELDKEEEYMLTMEGVFGETNRKLAKAIRNLAEKDETLAQQTKALAQKDEENKKQAEEIEKLKKLLESKK